MHIKLYRVTKVIKACQSIYWRLSICPS